MGCNLGIFHKVLAKIWWFCTRVFTRQNALKTAWLADFRHERLLNFITESEFIITLLFQRKVPIMKLEEVGQRKE